MGVSFSELSLGTVELGLDYGIRGGPGQPSPAEAERLLHSALDLGINHIDTARSYGSSEAIIGATLATRRKEYLITTKVAVDNVAAPVEMWDEMAASVEMSLKLLRTSCVDVLMLHSASLELIERGVAAEALSRLRDKGYCRFIGASVYGNPAAMAAIRSGAFDCLQVAYSALDRRPEAEVFPEAERNGIGIIARSVLLKGALTFRHRFLPECFAPLKNVVASLDSRSDSLPGLAYRYALNSMPPHTVLAGVSTVAELEELVGFSEGAAAQSSELEMVRQLPSLAEEFLDPSRWPATGAQL